MIAVTIVLLLVLAVLAPIKVRVYATFCPSELTAEVKVRLYFAKIFVEKATVQGGMIVLSGTIGDCVRLVDVDMSGGVDLTKCVTLDELRLLVRPGLLSVTATTVLPVVCSVVGDIAAFTHAKFGVCVQPTIGKTDFHVMAKVTTNLAEVGLYLLGVR